LFLAKLRRFLKGKSRDGNGGEPRRLSFRMLSSLKASGSQLPIVVTAALNSSKIVMPPMLKQSRGLRRDLPKINRQRAPLVHLLSQFVDDLPTGVLVGTVEITDCSGEPGDYRWHLARPAAIATSSASYEAPTASLVQSVLAAFRGARTPFRARVEGV
jgi:hypothetical protein